MCHGLLISLSIHFCPIAIEYAAGVTMAGRAVPLTRSRKPGVELPPIEAYQLEGVEGWPLRWNNDLIVGTDVLSIA
jgi:hypothetical protein